MLKFGALCPDPRSERAVPRTFFFHRGACFRVRLEKCFHELPRAPTSERRHLDLLQQPATQFHARLLEPITFNRITTEHNAGAVVPPGMR
jgi:hypothetical protein